MPRVLQQRTEDTFPALKENMVSSEYKTILWACSLMTAGKDEVRVGEDKDLDDVPFSLRLAVRVGETGLGVGEACNCDILPWSTSNSSRTTTTIPTINHNRCRTKSEEVVKPRDSLDQSQRSANLSILLSMISHDIFSVLCVALCVVYIVCF